MLLLANIFGSFSEAFHDPTVSSIAHDLICHTMIKRGSNTDVDNGGLEPNEMGVAKFLPPPGAYWFEATGVWIIF
jgi:hypothetical protein